MFISYEDDEIRKCCLLLRPGSINSSFTASEIKEIRAFIADLKAATKLTDTPIKYSINKSEGIITITYNSFKIISKIISSLKNPMEDQIERIKVLDIINVGLQNESSKKQKFN